MWRKKTKRIDKRVTPPSTKCTQRDPPPFPIVYLVLKMKLESTTIFHRTRTAFGQVLFLAISFASRAISILSPHFYYDRHRQVLQHGAKPTWLERLSNQINSQHPQPVFFLPLTFLSPLRSIDTRRHLPIETTRRVYHRLCNVMAPRQPRICLVVRKHSESPTFRHGTVIKSLFLFIFSFVGLFLFSLQSFFVCWWSLWELHHRFGLVLQLPTIGFHSIKVSGLK